MAIKHSPQEIVALLKAGKRFPGDDEPLYDGSEKLDQAILAIRGAILNEGMNPEYHREVMRTLQEEWPTLYRAVMRLIEIT